MIWQSFKSGCRCGLCAANRKKTIEDVRKEFLDRGFILTSKEYINSTSNLDFICDKGHNHSITYTNFHSGQGCGVCSPTKEKTIEEIKEFCESSGFTLLSTKYSGRNESLELMCNAGHHVYLSWEKVLAGSGCKVCANDYRKENMISRYQSKVSEMGFSILSKPTSLRSFTKISCPEGHVFYVKLKTVGNRSFSCPHCSNRCAHSTEYIRETFRRFGYVLKSEYIGSKEPLYYICDKGHYNTITWDSFNSKGVRCSKCNPNTSHQEIDLRDSISLLAPDVKMICNTRSVIPPYELDIYFPDKSVAVEYCGLYWHSEKSGDKDKYYHSNKYNLSLSKGIRLITVFEDEWVDRKEVVLSRILSSLGINRRLFARKLKCSEIDNKVANDFYDKYHLQGSTTSIKSWGLFDGDSLVSCLSVGKLSRYHTSKGGKYIELKRMASIPFVNIVGGFSRLFSAAKKYLKETEFEGIKS
jgi:hypothetical protein